MLVLKETFPGSRMVPASLPAGANATATAVNTKIDNRNAVIL